MLRKIEITVDMNKRVPFVELKGMLTECVEDLPYVGEVMHVEEIDG